MKITRFHATDDGESRFQEIELPVNQERRDPFGNIMHQSNACKGHLTRVIEGPAMLAFIELPPGFDFDRWSS